jgi:hypothetical protein
VKFYLMLVICSKEGSTWCAAPQSFKRIQIAAGIHFNWKLELRRAEAVQLTKA